MTTTKKRTSPTTCQFYILISLYFLLIVALAINCNWGATILTIIVPFTAYQIIQYPHSIGIRLCLGMIVLAGILIQIFQELNIYAATTLNRSISQIMHAIPLTHSTIALCKLCPFQSSTHKKKEVEMWMLVVRRDCGWSFVMYGELRRLWICLFRNGNAEPKSRCEIFVLKPSRTDIHCNGLSWKL